MLNSCNYNGNQIIFNKSNDHNNIFSVLVGVNGVGKSRLLSSLAIKFSGIQARSRAASAEGIYKISDHLFPDCTKNFNKVIASSISPFDKFPINNNQEDNYHYLGIRNIKSQSIGFSHMSRIIGEFIHKIINNELNTETIGNILKYLGYKNDISFSFSYSYSLHYHNLGFTNETLKEANNILKKYNSQFKAPEIDTKISSVINDLEQEKRRINEIIENEEKKNKSAKRKYYLNDFHHLVNSLSEIKKIGFETISEFKYFFDAINDSYLNFNLTESNLIINTKDEILLKIIKSNFKKLLLNEHIKIHSINVKKNNSEGKQINLTAASSGEQSVLLSLIGISTYIEDDSLILIDEPEICLHPSWQEKYISLLIDSFSEKKGCHFIIATHSPQIISNLYSKNCYIIDLSNKKTYESKDFIKRSADFQLLNIFNAPGYRNEYLLKLITKGLSQLSTQLKIDSEEIQTYEDLISKKENLNKDDPTLDLLQLLEKALAAYKNK